MRLFFVIAVLPAWAQPGLHATIAEIAKDAGGKVSVACGIEGTSLNCDLNANAQPPMQSVFKLPLAIAMLHEVEAGRFHLDQLIRFKSSDRILPRTYSPLQDEFPNAEVDIPLQRLLQLAVSQSDNAAADTVLRVIGGPEVVQRYIHGLGIEGFGLQDNEAALHRNPKLQYRNSFQASSAVRLLQKIASDSPLTPEHTNLILTWMRETPRGNARIPGLLPGLRIPHKPGTSGTADGLTPATNDIGLIPLPGGRMLAIAIFVTDSSASLEMRESVIARIAKAAYEAALALQ